MNHHHNHHHIPRGPFAGGPHGFGDPFAGSAGDPFAGGAPDGGASSGGPRRGFRDASAGPDPRGGRGRFSGGPGFGPGAGFGPGFGPGAFGPGPFGPGPFGPGFGPGGPHGHGRGGHRGRRAGRGDIRAAVLLLLAEQPRHGYELIREISERTDGAWTPSPGAIYPALTLLEDEGLVTIAAEGGRRLASLSEAGRAYVSAHADELGDPFADANARTPQSRWALRDALRGLMGASMQVAQNGDESQIARALVVLDGARKDLYRVLAGDQPSSGSAPSSDDEPEA